MQATRYIMSVDVEDYFHVEAFNQEVSRKDWDSFPSRVVANTQRALDLCDEFGVKGTYFILGWVADKFPSLVREIHARGHELACHSFWHRTVYSLTPEEFRQDLRQACDAIEQAAGVRVTGYRAPSWSITATSLWALDILSEAGFQYDSSIYPIHHDLYGIPGAQRFPYRIGPAAGMMEFPPATVKVLGATVPYGGGGYLRILPFWFTQWALGTMTRENSRVIVVYFHPWELDPEQPRIQARLKSRFRHYTNLHQMEPRLRRLMSTNPFETFAGLMENAQHEWLPA
jgi:polysaccharide deacetylase family protein (PEP-CTERM system associated)